VPELKNRGPLGLVWSTDLGLAAYERGEGKHVRSQFFILEF